MLSQKHTLFHGITFFFPQEILRINMFLNISSTFITISKSAHQCTDLQWYCLFRHYITFLMNHRLLHILCSFNLALIQFQFKT